jgi:hypothetical protein
MAVAATFFLVWLRRGCDRDALAGAWQARSALVFYDHLEAIELDGAGNGGASWGWEQNVHFTGRFEYELGASTLTLRYVTKPVSGTRRELAYAIATGTYTFERTLPTGRIERTRCERRLTFDDTPFPPGFAKATEYFGRCTVEGP